jgi:hypothetical protein
MSVKPEQAFYGSGARIAVLSEEFDRAVKALHIDHIRDRVSFGNERLIMAEASLILTLLNSLFDHETLLHHANNATLFQLDSVEARRVPNGEIRYWAVIRSDSLGHMNRLNAMRKVFLPQGFYIHYPEPAGFYGLVKTKRDLSDEQVLSILSRLSTCPTRITRSRYAYHFQFMLARTLRRLPEDSTQWSL